MIVNETTFHESNMAIRLSSIIRIVWSNCLVVFYILWHYCFYRYASRVKLITNQASKNSDNKEIARLKSVSIFILFRIKIYTII